MLSTHSEIVVLHTLDVASGNSLEINFFPLLLQNILLIWWLIFFSLPK